jgi:hypothetical protein
VNHGINITLIIVGIMALAAGPVGLIILVIAALSIRHRRRQCRRYNEALAAQAALKERRLRILAFKSLP